MHRIQWSHRCLNTYDDGEYFEEAYDTSWIICVAILREGLAIRPPSKAGPSLYEVAKPLSEALLRLTFSGHP